ncbi:BlaI/MecI/CopY family transcriptional regulator [Streptacidiphilus sp. EB103A]|uniref:BlaI/MecI/CopY family transcriptional regulator n=1 Tax=Streptacidiphilus sp. EB103A TaxID=3156275 RepID=UPI00351669A6
MPGFGELEASIMDRVWAAAPDPVTVRDVVNQLQRDRQVAYTTVQTVMEILHRKGWLSRQLHGRAYLYRSTASRADYVARLMGEALAVTPDRSAALATFAERMDPDEAETLRRALDAARSARSDPPGPEQP